MRTLMNLDSVWQDLRYGTRILRRNPTFAIVAILTLALGTGANTAIFQLVDAVRMRTLPVQSPQQLAEIRIDSGDHGRTGSFTSRRAMLTNTLWERIRDQQQAFSSVMAWSASTFDLANGGEARLIEGLWVSGGFFDTLGVKPARGRLIGPADDTRGCAAPGAVISHAFWHREYGGDPSIVGRTILVDGHRFDIIGVTPETFFGVEVGRSFDLAVPLCSEPIFRGAQTRLDQRDAWFLASIGRLKSDWTIDRTRAHLKAISSAIFKETLPERFVPEDAKAYVAFSFTAEPAANGISSLRRTYSTPLWILLGVTGLVLLVTCANLANLMLARATAREREIGVRTALGASRLQTVRQMLIESLLLAVLGAMAGLLLARWLSEFLVAFLSTDRNPLFLDLAFDWRTFAFTAAVAAGACLVFGLAPAIRAAATNPSSAIVGARGSSDARERSTLRRTLVVIQVAVSLVLLVGALLFVRSLRNLITVDPGFREEGVLVVNLDMRRAAVPAESRRVLYDTIVDRLKAVPGVTAAAEVFIAPLSGSGWNNRVLIDSQLQPGIVNFNGVGPGYFRALDTRLVAGRDFTTNDAMGSTPVAIVNELFVKKYSANASPLGRVVHVEDAPGSEANPRYQIIGVVADTNYSTLREDRVPIVYLPARQEKDLDPFLQIVVHTSIGMAGITPGVTQAVRGINPAISIQYQTMERLVRNSLTSERLMATLSGFFGGLAVLIATVGLYGVMSYMVVRRRLEIGIRMALGADRSTVVRMVVGDAARLLGIGLGVGLMLSIVAARSAGALLYGIEPWDPVTLMVAAIALGAIALLASWLPAQRASRILPTAALRDQ
jgi:putative ABC transport system permease protein